MDEDLLKYKRNLGIIQIALGASLLSFSPVFVNFANVGPAVAGFYRMLFGAVVLLLALIICKVPLWQGRAHFMWAFFCSFLFTLDLVLWHRSIYYIGPGLATLLSSCQIFLLVDFEFFVLKEKIPFQLMLGIILAMVGLYCIVGIDWHTLAPHEKTGVFLGLFTALCYAAYVLILRKIQPGAGELSLKNLATLTLITLLNLGLMGGVALVCKESFMIPDTQSWWVLLGYGVVSQVLAWTLIGAGVAVVQPSLIGLLLILQPALAFVWDILIFNRNTPPLEVVGVVLVIGGIYLGARQGKNVRLARPALARRKED